MPRRRKPYDPDLLHEIEMDLAMQELADLSLRYPFRWFPQAKVARICGFGEEVLSAFGRMGAPIVARKCNPHLLQKWLEENVETISRIGKIRDCLGGD